MATTTLPYFRRPDAALVAWSNNFIAILDLQSGGYGLTTAHVAALSQANDAWVAAAASAANPETRTKVTVAARTAARDAFLAAAKNAIAIIDSTASVTEAMKIAIDIPIPKPRQRRNAPTVSPAIDFGSRDGTTVSVTLHEPGNARRALSRDADGILMYSFVGAEPPADPQDWTFAGKHSRREADIVFESNLPAGTQVWITAQYFNARGTGPGASPITTVLAGGGSVGAKMKLAA